MFISIKLNKGYWPKAILNLWSSRDDPRVLLESDVNADAFSRAVSVFLIGETYKWTKKQRYPITVKKLASLGFHSTPVVIDVGASDGTASLGLIEKLNFSKYYVTDSNKDVSYVQKDGSTYFYDSDRRCVLIVSDKLIVYPGCKTSFFPLNILLKLFISDMPNYSRQFEVIKLVNPELKKLTSRNVFVLEYDIFNEWNNEKADLVIVANLLNRVYFSDELIRKALSNILNALKEGGRFAIIDNRDVEKSTIFRFADGRIYVETDINGGTEIKDIILGMTVR